MIIALAGRRVDNEATNEPRFPASQVESVRLRIRDLLRAKGTATVVSSAACGADLIALSAAGELGIRRIVVLPFARAPFRNASVTDRGGAWGVLYDSILDAVSATGDLIVLNGKADNDSWGAANGRILDEAILLAQATHQPAEVVLVWDGVARRDRDLTEEFGTEARRRGLAVSQISTI